MAILNVMINVNIYFCHIFYFSNGYEINDLKASFSLQLMIPFHIKLSYLFQAPHHDYWNKDVSDKAVACLSPVDAPVLPGLFISWQKHSR